RGDQQVPHLLDVALVGDVDGDDDAPDAIVADPVLDHAAHEIGVRNDQSAAIEGFDLGGAGVDAVYESLFVSHHHPVPDADAALPQQDETGDKIVGDRLQAEADADREPTGDERELLDVKADLRAGESQGDDHADIAEDRPDRVADAGVEARIGQEPRAK